MRYVKRNVARVPVPALVPNSTTRTRRKLNATARGWSAIEAPVHLRVATIVEGHGEVRAVVSFVVSKRTQGQVGRLGLTLVQGAR